MTDGLTKGQVCIFNPKEDRKVFGKGSLVKGDKVLFITRIGTTDTCLVMTSKNIFVGEVPIKYLDFSC